MTTTSRSGAAGYTLLELMFVMGLIATLTAVAIPHVSVEVDEARTAAAARYVASRLHHARMLAVSGSTNVGIRFVGSGDGYEFTLYADRNRNGIRTADIMRGADAQVEEPARLAALFAGSDFGALRSLPLPDGGSGTVGDDPIKFGPSHLVSFSPDGSSSSGSLYVRGRRGAQYVVRVLGDTGRIRMLKFNARIGKWQTLQ